uniref:Uncharacterized protein n=1 Tax=Glossina pallidipes TaxID=7398 RepID=A0A1B0A7Y2_GLOPL
MRDKVFSFRQSFKDSYRDFNKQTDRKNDSWSDRRYNKAPAISVTLGDLKLRTLGIVNALREYILAFFRPPVVLDQKNKGCSNCDMMRLKVKVLLPLLDSVYALFAYLRYYIEQQLSK